MVKGAVLLGFLLLSVGASACTCRINITVADHFQQAYYVFYGRLTEVAIQPRRVEEPLVLADLVVADFEIIETFKGDPENLDALKTEGSSAMCGVQFETTLEYVFFVADDGTVSLCGGTIHGRQRKFDAVLRMLRTNE